MGDFYTGYSNSMDPKNKNFYLHNYRLGAPTSPMHAKQLEEFGKRLNSGMMNVEVGTLDPQKFETIPTEHFESIKQLADLTGAKPSLHGPLLDLAGFESQSRRWSETERRGTVQHIMSMLERAHKMDPKGNLPVVFHAGGTFSQEFAKDLKEDYHVLDEKTGDYVKKVRDYKPFGKDMPGVFSLGVVNPETGETNALTYEEKYSILERERQIWTPHRRLSSMNRSQWDKEKLEVLGFQKEIEELRQKLQLKKEQNDAIIKTGLDKDSGYRKTFDQNSLDIDILSHHITQIREHLDSSMSDTYDKFNKGFKDVSAGKQAEYKAFQKKKEGIHEAFQLDRLNKEIKKGEKGMQYLVSLLEKAPDKKRQDEIRGQINHLQDAVAARELERSKALVREVTEMPVPQLWRPVADFAKGKTIETVSEVMTMAYDKFGEKAPFIALENFLPNTPMSTANELRETILGARKKFAKNLVEKKNLSKGKAKEVAEKLIGATWDVGHINQLRKAGLTGEELKKKVIDETKKIADVVKHVHITDNFGFHDSHLPPGMGNVPVKDIMRELEAHWKKIGKTEGLPRSIIEAGGFVAEIGQDPTIASMEYFESPMYKLGPGPYWTQDQTSSYGTNFIEFPQTHFNLYGSSFTTLPKELGGQIGGEKSRFSDSPLS